MRVCEVVLTDDQISEADRALDGDPDFDRAWAASELAQNEASHAEAAFRAAEERNSGEAGSVEDEQHWLEAWNRHARAEYKSALAQIGYWRRLLKARANYARKLVEGSK